MDEGKKNFEKLAQSIVEFLYIGDSQHVAKYYCNTMRWITADYDKVSLTTKKEFDGYIGFLSKQKVQIVHLEYHAILVTKHASLVIGSYYAAGSEKILHNITLLFVMEDYIKIKYMHISERVPENSEHWIKGVDEKLYLIRERELLYLESNHNHVIWHCRDVAIEAVGSLKNAEIILSNKFVRIHKGFIIHKKHVVRIGRCFVEMDNGDSMLIPEKKYVEIRNQLLEQ